MGKILLYNLLIQTLHETPRLWAYSYNNGCKTKYLLYKAVEKGMFGVGHSC